MPAPRVSGPQRAAPNGNWFDPSHCPQPRLSAMREDVYEYQRSKAAIRLKHIKGAQGRSGAQLGGHDESFMSGRTSPSKKSSQTDRISPTNPLQPPWKTDRSLAGPLRHVHLSSGRGKIRLGARGKDSPQQLKMEMVHPAGTPLSPGSKTSADSASDRLAGKGGGAKKSGGSRGKGSSSRAKGSSDESSSKEAHSSTSKGEGKDSSDGGKSTRTRKRKGLPDKAQEPLLPSADFFAEVEVLLQQAATHESEADEVGRRDDFEHRLARTLTAQTKPLSELVRDWDKNRDGDINTIELRACVRNSLAIKASNEEIDAWFAKADGDAGGALEFTELKRALKALKDMLLTDQAEIAQLQATAAEVRQKAKLVEEVANATAEYEASSAKYVQMVERPALDARLGAVMAKRNIKIGDVASNWDANHDGMMSKVEFRNSVSEMGVEATAEEIDELFDSYDTTGNGALRVEDIKPRLKELIELAQTAKGTLLRMKAKLAEQRLMVLKEQQDYAAAKQEEEAAAEAEAMARELAKVQKAEARAEAKRAAEEARAAAVAAKAAEEAAYEAKIAARREANASTQAKQMWQQAGDAVIEGNQGSQGYQGK